MRSLITTYTMNLLANKLSIKRLFKPGLILLIPVFFGCETQSDLGIQYDLGSEANVKFVEFTLPATNMYLDSLRTDGEPRVLAGVYSDELIGSVSAEGYLTMVYDNGPLPRGLGESTDTLELDSMVIYLEANAMIPANTNGPFSVSLAQLANELDASAIYLSNTKQDTISNIASRSLEINPSEDTIFRFALDSTYSRLFFNGLGSIGEDESQSITTATFQPIGIFPESGTEKMLSIDLISDTTKVTVYTSSVDLNNGVVYETNFRLTSTNYTYLERNRNGSQFAGIQEKTNFDLPSGQTIIDPIAGITTAYTVSQVEDFFADNPNIIINSAIFASEFEEDSGRDTLVNFIQFMRKGDLSIFGPALANLTTSFDNIVMTDNAYLTVQSDPTFGRLNDDGSEILVFSALYYQRLYREFFEGGSIGYQTLSGNVKNITDLVLVSPFEVSLQRTIFSEGDIKLRIYYTEVDQ